MANAWCINAIWFDWSLIRTLQNLDSSNIWVWVQFTAPNPLDDKRFDYIKYTDKCWNTCCLSWENEILIYATNWTIKNLTLTNDDANEVVNVKRSDVFWSNRKKTVVRYKTWWYPTSITDWTLAVEELVQNQYASTWYNVSWLSDWTTYYFSAFAVAQDDTIIVVQTDSITPEYWRKPDANTVVYYDIDSSDTSSTIYDKSWNWNNLSWWTLVYTTDSVAWRVFKWQNYSTLPRRSLINFWQSFSFIARVMFTGSWNVFANGASSSSHASNWIASTNDWNIVGWASWIVNDTRKVSSTWTVSFNTRACVWYSRDSTWKLKVFINWSKSWETTISANVSYSYWEFVVWWRRQWDQYPMKWYLKILIWENRTRDESEFLSYYNKTKSKFWIS